MPIQPIRVLTEAAKNLEDLSNEIAKMQKILNYLLEGNLDFDNIRARGIKAENIQAGAITANEIAADTITADKMDVDELSAITANLGTINVGTLIGVLIQAATIIGSYIATANGTYPRAEMDSSLNQFAAFTDANNWIKMLANSSGTPLVQFSAASGALTGAIGLNSVFDELRIISNRSINLISGIGNVKVPSWSTLVNDSSGQNLQNALNGKANAFSGFTGTIYVATTPGGSPTTAKTFTNGVCTS